MQSDLRAQIDLMNRNVDEMIRLCQCATDAGVWTQHEARRHTARLESLRTKLNADFQELARSREYVNANASRISTRDVSPPTKK
jgi:hypothetical protein